MWEVNGDYLAYAIKCALAVQHDKAQDSQIYFSSLRGLVACDGKHLVQVLLPGANELPLTRVEHHRLKELKLPRSAGTVTIAQEDDTLRFAAQGWSQSIMAYTNKEYGLEEHTHDAFIRLIERMDNPQPIDDFALAAASAEFVAKILPKGTHAMMFSVNVSDSEQSASVRPAGLTWTYDEVVPCRALFTQYNRA